MPNYSAKRHVGRKKCAGYGLVFGFPDVYGPLRREISAAGFAISVDRIGSSERIRFGTAGCADCREWLRK